VHIQHFWQRNHQIHGHIRCMYTVLANPTHLNINHRNKLHHFTQQDLLLQTSIVVASFSYNPHLHGSAAIFVAITLFHVHKSSFLCGNLPPFNSVYSFQAPAAYVHTLFFYMQNLLFHVHPFFYAHLFFYAHSLFSLCAQPPLQSCCLPGIIANGGVRGAR